MPRLRPEAESKEPPKTEGLFESKPEPAEVTALEMPESTRVELVDKSKEVLLPAKEEPDEATLALQKQIADLKKSEELQREYAQRMVREREEAIRRAEAHAAEVEQYKKTNQEQEEVAIGSALAAAKAEADKALSDYKNALDAGDTSAQAEAMDKLTDAKANLRLLERGKEEIEQRKKETPKVEQPKQPTGDPIDGFNLPDGEKNWLRAHRDYLTDQRKVSALRYADEMARLEGLQPGHPGYLPKIEDVLQGIGSMPKPEESKDEPVAEPGRAAIVSAPVSREAPSGSTGQRPSTSKVKLSPEEQEFARLSGITEVEYARQKQKLNQMKVNGEYGERR